MTNTKDALPPDKSTPNNYEAAVLDFLDREMAGLQANQTEAKQSEELDALVANLLQQVMSESDEPKTGDMIVTPENINDLLAEFIPGEESPSPAQDRPGDIAQESAHPEEPSLSQHAATKPDIFSASMIATASPNPGRHGLRMIAAAVLCVLALAAIGLYYFSKTPRHSSDPGMPAVGQVSASTQASPTPVPEAPLYSPDTVTVPPPATQVPEKKSEARNLKSPADAPEKLVDSKPGKTVTTTSALPGPPAREERIIEPQPAQHASTIPPPPEIESPVLDWAAAARRPVPQPPIAPILAAKPSVEATPPAPSPQSAASAASRELIPAVAITQVSPKYPEFAVRTRSSGVVVLELDVDKDGRVVKATPLSGPEMFYKEAIAAAMQWRYRPASVGGTNVSSQVKVTFNFNLK